MSYPHAKIEVSKKGSLMSTPIHTIYAVNPTAKVVKVIDLTYDGNNFTVDQAIKSVEDKGFVVIYTSTK